jgi:hypothetical protein
MAAVVLFMSLPLDAARAGMVATESVIEESAEQDARARVLDFMAREDVRRQIEELGVDPDEATRRVQGLSDAEIAQIAGQLDQDPAGQNGAIAAIVGAAVLIFLVLLITDLLCLTDIFNFTRCAR